jgi:hypothetical protein
VVELKRHANTDQHKTYDKTKRYEIRTIYREKLIESPESMEWISGWFDDHGLYYEKFTLSRILEVINPPGDMSEHDVKSHIRNIESLLDKDD